MPGLFGFVAIEDPTGIERDFAESLFSKMEQRLHHPSQQIDRWRDPGGGAYVGRVGPPRFDSIPWGSSAEAGERRVFSFCSGSLQADRQGSDYYAQSFLDQGFDSIGELRGFYAIVLHSLNPCNTIIAVDRRASIPLYYAEWNGLLLFAPELKALLSVPELSRELDWGAIGTYLGSGHVLGHQSLLSAVRRLQGGQALSIEQGRVARREYWKFGPGANLDGSSTEDLEEELGELVAAAVGRNLGEPDRTAIFLSGGGDSRGILGGALDAVGGDGQRLSTVCWGARRGTAVSDAGIAQRIADTFQLSHRYVERRVDNYAKDFHMTNGLLDGQSDMAALHPYEHQLMLNLQDAGFNRALRGDQVFASGGGRHVYVHSLPQALAEAGLRRVRDLAPVSMYVRPSTYKLLSEASDAAMDSVLDSVRSMEPNDAKHYLYFSHRVQSYLNSGAYLKQVVFDTRNALLDEDVLSFLERVPAVLRTDKLLYLRAMRRKYPELWSIPMATEHDLEDWNWQLGNDTHVRRFAIQQFDDERSGIWQYFDRSALRTLLDSLVNPAPQNTNAGRRFAKSVLRKTLLSVAPRAVSSMLSGREARYHPTNRALLRVMSLKNWYDTNIG